MVIGNGLALVKRRSRTIASASLISRASDATRSSIWLRVVLFVVIYFFFHWAYQALRASSLDPLFIRLTTVSPASFLFGWLWPLDGVAAEGPSLVWRGGRLTLLAGCDGFDVMALFVAAMLASDVAWRRGVTALIFGCAGIWILNQLRVAALYWSFRYERAWFDPVHTIWGPLLLIVLVAAIYAWALRGGLRGLQSADE